MNHDIANGEFGIVSIRHPAEGSPSSSRMLMHQYTPTHKKRDSKQQELALGPTTCNMIGVTELAKVKEEGSLELTMTVEIERNIEEKKKTDIENSEIHFFLPRFIVDWKEALILLFRQLPAEQRVVEADISYQDILDRRNENKSLDQTNSNVMGSSAEAAFINFMKDKPIKLTNEQMSMIVPNWCHIIMGSAITSKIAQSKGNLCCAPEGLNIRMHVPEHMVVSLAQDLHYRHKRVHVTVNLALMVGTSILKSMEYEIRTDEVKIFVKFDHPFQQPHFHFENQGVAHLSDVMGRRLKL